MLAFGLNADVRGSRLILTERSPIAENEADRYFVNQSEVLQIQQVYADDGSLCNFA